MTYAIVIAIFLKKNCTPEGVQRKKEIVFFSCIAFSKFITGISFFQLFHYLTVEDTHGDTVDVVVKTATGGITAAGYIEGLPCVVGLSVG